MRDNKLMYLYLFIMIIFSFVNILVCFQILTFEAWKVTLWLSTILSGGLTVYGIYINKSKGSNHNVQIKRKKEQIIVLSILIIWASSVVVTLFI
ncbi:hypothetical protein [Clostridium gasigenes]|uniref:Uncharacterized protein n=1 Tax=Clostridium gasigenes TaxID=94869 RepID=A0A7X0SCW6_9CLOT|nr:hypothetical protein [Clostridium gasigenes]MBB6715254.1 hypothetical protein [Clostridium gasigenes]